MPTAGKTFRSRAVPAEHCATAFEVGDVVGIVAEALVWPHATSRAHGPISLLQAGHGNLAQIYQVRAEAVAGQPAFADVAECQRWGQAQLVFPARASVPADAAEIVGGGQGMTCRRCSSGRRSARTEHRCVDAVGGFAEQVFAPMPCRPLKGQSWAGHRGLGWQPVKGEPIDHSLGGGMCASEWRLRMGSVWAMRLWWWAGVASAGRLSAGWRLPLWGVVCPPVSPGVLRGLWLELEALNLARAARAPRGVTVSPQRTSLSEIFVFEAYHDHEESVCPKDASRPPRRPMNPEFNVPKELLDQLVKGPMTQGDLESIFRAAQEGRDRARNERGDERAPGLSAR